MAGSYSKITVLWYLHVVGVTVVQISLPVNPCDANLLIVLSLCCSVDVGGDEA